MPKQVKHLVIDDVDVIEDEYFVKLQPKEIKRIKWVIDRLKEKGLNVLLSSTDYAGSIQGYDNLYYLRIQYRTNIYRVFLCKYKKFYVLLYGIVKKTQRLQQNDINKANQRKSLLLINEN